MGWAGTRHLLKMTDQSARALDDSQLQGAIIGVLDVLDYDEKIRRVLVRPRDGRHVLLDCGKGEFGQG